MSAGPEPQVPGSGLVYSERTGLPVVHLGGSPLTAEDVARFLGEAEHGVVLDDEIERAVAEGGTGRREEDSQPPEY